MRILMISTLYPNPLQPQRGTFNRQQLKGLDDHHAVAVISPISWIDELSARWKGHARLAPDRRVILDGIPVDYPRFYYLPKIGRNWLGHCYRHCAKRCFERALTEFQADIILGSWAYPDGWAAVELGQRAGLPVVVKVHGCDVLCGGLGLRQFPNRRRRTVEAFQRADGIVAVSRHLAEQVLELGIDPQRVHVVYNGIDTRLFCPGSAEEAQARLGLEKSDPIILYVASLDAVKGPEVLIDACARLAREQVRFACYLIGQGPLKSELEGRIKHLGLAQRVRLLGSVPHDQLPDWYRSAHVLVLPSFSEGIPNVLLEAGACGTPFVASRVGGVPEIPSSAGNRLVDPGNPQVLAEAIVQTLQEGKKVAQPQTFFGDWADSAAALVQVLQPLVSPGREKEHREQHRPTTVQPL